LSVFSGQKSLPVAAFSQPVEIQTGRACDDIAWDLRRNRSRSLLISTVIGVPIRLAITLGIITGRLSIPFRLLIIVTGIGRLRAGGSNGQS
jgi:hypothetical protein